MPNDKQDQNEKKTSGMNPINRHNARRYALQAMYQWQVSGSAATDLEAEFLRYHIDKQLDMDYFKELIHGIIHHQHEIDQAMQPFLSRSIKEIDPVELSVLRLAIYELIKRPDVPYRVIINEALELTKKFGSIEGYKFVNGILDRVAKTIRTNESALERPQSEAKTNRVNKSTLERLPPEGEGMLLESSLFFESIGTSF